MSKSCSGVIGLLLALLFVIAAISALTFYQIEYNLLRPEPYVRALQSGDFSARLTEIASGELAAAFDSDPCMASQELCTQAGGPPAYFVRLSEDDWKRMLDLLITPEWVAEQSETVLRGLFNLLDPDSSFEVPSIEIGTIKARLLGSPGTQLIDLLLGSLPPCTPEQATELAQMFLSGGNVEDLLVCSPPPELSEFALPILNQQLSVVAARLPDQIELPFGDMLSDRTPDGAEAIARARGFIRLGLLVSVAAVAGSLLLMLIFVVRSMRDFSLWSGWPIFSFGVLSLLMTLTIRGSSEALFQYLVVTVDGPVLQPETLSFVGELFQTVIRSVLRESMMIALGATGVGFVLVVSSFFFPGERKQAPVGQRPENLY
ncbi:MAG: hypothetical protein P1P76_00030 [Anaerolineales bacterium]|nr:hypothetical protein [Anaerolineales bacterium]